MRRGGGADWKGPQEIMWSTHPARAGWTGLRPDSFECLQKRKLHNICDLPYATEMVGYEL